METNFLSKLVLKGLQDECYLDPVYWICLLQQKNDFEKHLSNKINESKATTSCHHCHMNKSKITQGILIEIRMCGERNN